VLIFLQINLFDVA